MGFLSLFNKTSRYEKASEQHRPLVDAVNKLASEMNGLSDEDLKSRVVKYKGKPLDELRKHLPEIFAAVREGGERALKMRHFDVQIMGGAVLLDGKIAEMKTGEGKTLAATLPLIVHALTGRGAHLVTVNDYLSARDAEWMKPLYEYFGLTVGVSVHGQSPEEKREAYEADITYGTNNEFGFDYLRDNMAQSKDDIVQGDLSYAIVDEVDSILIDEARTPLIISAPDAESTHLYEQFSKIVPSLKENNHYNLDEKRKAATLTDKGVTKVEEMLGVDNIYEEKGIRFVHHLEQALRAQTLYHRDKDYVVKEGQVIIVDEFTGRMMEGRRYSEGLHQAIEAKEGVKVQQESRTLASITFQNFFRLYESLAGMTGTAVTSAEEFEKVYNLDVVMLPTNKPLVRNDRPDRILMNEKAKFTAVVNEIKKRHEKGQPILVGTVAIEKSEYLSKLLDREGIKHEVLNAKHHAREAEIITAAGQKGAVTISTNMAGRGTDIKLGEGVADVGGLFVLGTERHEARRIDNQLRGRSGRQGDPGETQSFVSLDDDVMRVFGGDRIKKLMERLKLPDDEPIENKLVSKAIAGAQERVEGYYFDMRKQVLSYDNVLNKQRTAIYTLRRGAMMEGKWKEANKETEDLHEHIRGLVEEQAEQIVLVHASESEAKDWNVKEMTEVVNALTGVDKQVLLNEFKDIVKEGEEKGPEIGQDKLTKKISEVMVNRFNEREREMGGEIMRNLEQAAAMRAIDTHWMDHLDTMDYLRTGIGLRGYGQRDPLVEYQKEGFRLFRELIGTIKGTIVEVVFKAEAVRREQQQGVEHHQSAATPHSLATGAKQEEEHKPSNVEEVTSDPNKGVGRNDPCPCGSGKKFKKCHGA